MRKYGLKKWLIICGFGCAFYVMAAGTAKASQHQMAFCEWINIDKGPGVAEWVDENGNVTKYPHLEKKKEEAAAPEETTQAEVSQELPELPTEAEIPQETLETEPEVPERVIDPARPMVALTFDDGPYAPVGNRIMDCLAQYGGKATFYVVGNRCANYKEEMQRMAAEGHEIGNHTYSHKYLNKLGAAQIQREIQMGNDAILAASGVSAATVRLPGGNKNATVLANVNAPMIMWSIDTLDWKTKNAESTINAVMSKVRDGDIVLMHELYDATGDAAIQIIPALVEQGYQLVTVSELALYRGGGLENGKVYYNFHN